MPTLEWIGKDKVVNHHLEVPCRVLEEQYTYNAEQSESMIIRGTIWRHSRLCCPGMREGSSASILIRPTTRATRAGVTMIT